MSMQKKESSMRKEQESSLMGDLEPGEPTILDLAEEAPNCVKKNASTFSKLFGWVALPMAALGIIILIANAVLIALPTNLVLINSSNAASADLVDQMTQRIVSTAATSINQFLQDPIWTTMDIAQNPYWTARFLSLTTNLQNDPELFVDVWWRVNTSANTDALLIAANRMPDTPGTVNITMLGAIKWRGDCILQDYASRIQNRYGIDPSAGTLTFTRVDLGAAEVINTNFKDFLNPYPYGKGKWIIWAITERFNKVKTPGLPDEIRIMMTYKHMFYQNPTDASPQFMTIADMQTVGNIDVLLCNLRQTPGTVNVLLDTDYYIVSTSAGNFAVNRTRALAVNSAIVTGTVGEVARKLQQIYPDTLERLPNNWASEMKLSDGTWLVKTTNIPIAGYNLVFITAIPRSDFYAGIDKGQREALILSVCITIGSAILGSAALAMMVRPLRELTLTMQQITKFDFSAIQSGKLDHRSVVAELRRMEVVFDTMCKAFAASIRRNRDLAKGGRGSSGGAKTNVAKMSAQML
ncbi:hypothetical protein HDU86_005980 [Geranomyces michiganensis]|nr:hypothetical protein HDU86_005980 [Geranomyces michiganensis]